MYKYLFLITLSFLICVSLFFVFYFNQRVVNIRNEFEYLGSSIENIVSLVEKGIKFNCAITGDWNENDYADAPLKIAEYGYPYKAIFVVTTPKAAKKIELMDIAIQYSSINCAVKNFQTEFLRPYDNSNEYYLTIKDFPIQHNLGQIVELKYKIRIVFEDDIIEIELETKFKAIRKLENSFVIIDNIMSV